MVRLGTLLAVVACARTVAALPASNPEDWLTRFSQEYLGNGEVELPSDTFLLGPAPEASRFEYQPVTSPRTTAEDYPQALGYTAHPPSTSTFVQYDEPSPRPQPVRPASTQQEGRYPLTRSRSRLAAASSPHSDSFSRTPSFGRHGESPHETFQLGQDHELEFQFGQESPSRSASAKRSRRLNRSSSSARVQQPSGSPAAQRSVQSRSPSEGPISQFSSWPTAHYGLHSDEAA